MDTSVQGVRATAAIAIAIIVTLVASPVPRAQSASSSFRVQVTGHGRPMILIPGLSSSGETWKTTVERYKDRYACHVVTLAGYAGVAPIASPMLAAARAQGLIVNPTDGDWRRLPASEAQKLTACPVVSSDSFEDRVRSFLSRF